MSNLSVELEKDIDEREAVIFEIEKVLFTKRYNISKKHLEIFTVQSISMLYAIWEGFVQKAFNLCVDEINAKKYDVADIKDELYVYHIEKTFCQFQEYPQKVNKKVSFFFDLNHFFNTNTLIIPNVVLTKSNVSFDVLNNLMKTFCFDPFGEHWGCYSYPNQTLKDTMTSFLRYRNGVAHGGDIRSEDKVTKDVYQKYKNLVLDLMREINLRMLDGIENNIFIKSL